MAEEADSNYCIREFELKEDDDTEILSLYQVTEGDVNSVVWDAGLTLAGYLQKLDQRKEGLFRHKNVIELGSGVGVCGMVAAYLGANSTLTDMKDSIKLLEYNVEQNRRKYPEMKATVEELIWSKESAEVLARKNVYDYVLVADCIYYADSIDPLVETLKTLMQPHTILIICQELRESRIQIELCKRFLAQVKEFLLIREVPRAEQHENYQCDEIMLFSCKRK